MSVRISGNQNTTGGTRSGRAQFLNAMFGIDLQVIDLPELTLPTELPELTLPTELPERTLPTPLPELNLPTELPERTLPTELQEHTLPTGPTELNLPTYLQEHTPDDPIDILDRTPSKMGGMSGKRVGDEYAGEHDRAGWRGKDEQEKQNTKVTTKSYTEEEVKQNTLNMGKDGSFKVGDQEMDDYAKEHNEDHDQFDDVKMGYAMDPSGKMVAFQDGYEISGKDANGNRVDEDDLRELLRTKTLSQVSQENPDLKIAVKHHSTALGSDTVGEGDAQVKQSREAASAGFVTFANDKIKRISNESGHYKPSVANLMQAVEHLQKQGAFFEEDLFQYKDGDWKPLDNDSKEAQLYKALQAKNEQAIDLKDQAEKLVGQIEQASKANDTGSVDNLVQQLDPIIGQIETLAAAIEKATTVLRKLGIGPGQKQTDAKAEFVEAKSGMTGMEVRTLQTKKMPVDEFLSTGGGYERQGVSQKDSKNKMLEELQNNERFKKAGVVSEQHASSGVAPNDKPSEQNVDEALQGLQGRDDNARNNNAQRIDHDHAGDDDSDDERDEDDKDHAPSGGKPMTEEDFLNGQQHHDDDDSEIDWDEDKDKKPTKPKMTEQDFLKLAQQKHQTEDDDSEIDWDEDKDKKPAKPKMTEEDFLKLAQQKHEAEDDDSEIDWDEDKDKKPAKPNMTKEEFLKLAQQKHGDDDDSDEIDWDESEDEKPKNPKDK